MRGMPSAAIVVQIILSHVVFIGGLHTPREFSVLVHFMTKRIVPPGTGFGPSNVLRQSSPEAVEVSKNVHQPTTPVESKPFTEAEVINRKGFVTDRSRRLEGLKEKIKQLNDQQVDAGIHSSGTVPDIIADRMLRRIVMFFGAPVMIGLLLFVGAFVYSQRTGEKIPATLVAYATQLPFALGLAGITWGILSSSWDTEAGSLLGWSEVKTNVARIREGLARGRETAALVEEIEGEKRRLGATENELL